MPTLQRAMTDAVRTYNAAPFQKRSGSRRLVFQEEKRYLRPLPTVPFEVETLVENRKVYPNCHVSLLKNWYSVPYIYRGMTVDIRYTEKIVEIYYDHQRIASHPKFPDYVTNRYSTREADMPDEFNKPEMDKDRMCSWASSVGPNTRKVVDRIFTSVKIKEQGFALDDGEIMEGLRCVGVPIFDEDGLVRYAISVSGQVKDIYGNRLERLIIETKRAAKEITYALSKGKGHIK